MATVTFEPFVVTSATRVDARLGRIRLAFWLFAIAAAALQAWVFRNTITNDGISYLDMGDAVAHGAWAAAISGYWSPLYPALVGVALWIAKPAAMHEFAVVHAVNFAVFLGAFASFEFLLRRLLRSLDGERLPDWLVAIAGYTVAIW